MENKKGHMKRKKKKEIWKHVKLQILLHEHSRWSKIFRCNGENFYVTAFRYDFVVTAKTVFDGTANFPREGKKVIEKFGCNDNL